MQRKLKERAESFSDFECLAHEMPPKQFYLGICVITPPKACKSLI